MGYAGSPAHKDAWASPAEVAALEAAGAPAHQQILYDFTHVGTAAQLNADPAELRHALPPGAIITSVPSLASAAQTGAGQQSNGERGRQGGGRELGDHLGVSYG